jgi:hypothetical protein
VKTGRTRRRMCSSSSGNRNPLQCVYAELAPGFSPGLFYFYLLVLFPTSPGRATNKPSIGFDAGHIDFLCSKR